MKNSVFNFIVLIFVLAISSCSTSSDKQNIYDRIATDKTYEILHESLSESALLIATDQIDLNAIGQYVNENPEITACDMNDEILVQIKGGVEYKRLNCKMEQSQNTLRKKYPEYNGFTRFDIHELRNAYIEKVSSSSEANSLTIIENINH